MDLAIMLCVVVIAQSVAVFVAIWLSGMGYENKGFEND
jgi:hypothetical protein